MRFAAVIFDFDGVVADSELAANTNLAETLTACGMPTTLDESLDHYMGHHWDDCVLRITERWGRPPPADLRERRAKNNILDAVHPIPGLAAFLDALGNTPRAIASSSRPEWIETVLARFGLLDRFAPNIFSAARDVARGKPHPDIYQHAMRAVGVQPADTLVIEDTSIGVRAGKAAGAFVAGLCAGNHIRDGHADQLLAAGADVACPSFADVSRLLG